MTQNVQITCIKKTNRTNPHERIEGIGGTNHDNTRWYLLLDKAIAGIESNKWKFYTSVNGKSVWIIIATHNGNKYLKTENDGIHDNNLLSLEECSL